MIHGSTQLIRGSTEKDLFLHSSGFGNLLKLS